MEIKLKMMVLFMHDSHTKKSMLNGDFKNLKGDINAFTFSFKQ